METFPEWKKRRRAETVALTAIILIPAVAVVAYAYGVRCGTEIGVRAAVSELKKDFELIQVEEAQP